VGPFLTPSSSAISFFGFLCVLISKEYNPIAKFDEACSWARACKIYRKGTRTDRGTANASFSGNAIDDRTEILNYIKIYYLLQLLVYVFEVFSEFFEDLHFRVLHSEHRMVHEKHVTYIHVCNNTVQRTDNIVDYQIKHSCPRDTQYLDDMV
jgi:hypothetical protein